MNNIGGPSGFDHRTAKEMMEDAEAEQREAEHDAQYSRGDLATKIVAFFMLAAAVWIGWAWYQTVHASGHFVH